MSLEGIQDVAAYWNARYAMGQTGWDLGSVSPAFIHYFSAMSNKEMAILIPGCGNSHEAAWLIACGFSQVTVLDIAPHAIQALRERFHAVDGKQLTIVQADFFEWDGQYDLIFEQTFFCAIHPDKRAAYVRQMHKLLRPNGQLVGLLFNRTFDASPPYGGSIDEYQVLFEPYFNPLHVQPTSLSVEPRQGTECWMEGRKKIA
ncbi:MAG: methyltransferase domain-containing protein [Ferruginibacter sp.]